MADARKDRRTLLSLKIRYKSATLEDFIERYSMDISRGGVFIKAKQPLAVGTLLKFEFLLQDQSTLIHGVGRVAWRREEAEADEDNPAGMGIKFIKMDPESRSVVQRIVEDRARPGVFDQGKAGASLAPDRPTDPGEIGGDQTKVRHVSEFLASAMEEGGAGEAAMREARAGVARARHIGRGAARGAFSAQDDVASARRAVSDSPSRAMSAFGGASMGAAGRMRSSAAPMMDELDAEDDFLDDETTKVKELGSSDFPDADATVVSAEASPFAASRRQTPVVPEASGSILEEAVPDLFGPDSFGPAPGEVIDQSLLDPSVQTVPPKASALPRSAIPDLAAMSSETFQVPQAPPAVASGTPRPKKSRGSRAWLLALLFVLLLVSAALAIWRLGLVEPLEELVAPYLGAFAPLASESTAESEPAVAAVPSAVTPEAASDVRPSESDEPEAAAQTESTTEPPRKAAPAPAAAEPAEANPTLVDISVVSVPSGAFVSINGEGVGRTPLELRYEPGTRLSLFSKARGFLGRRQRVVVDSRNPEIKLVLSPLPYVVEVVTEPPGARASAVGGGEVTTPGALIFKTMPDSRNIVISKDGYSTATKSVSRSSFVEERTRMKASIQVSLVKDRSTSVEVEPTVEPEPEPAEPEATPQMAPEASEPAVDDAP